MGFQRQHGQIREGNRSARFGIPWEDDSSVSICEQCQQSFTFFRRKHHCRICGDIFCGKCSKGRYLMDESMVSACRTLMPAHRPEVEATVALLRKHGARRRQDLI